jgi:hypothetical protein
MSCSNIVLSCAGPSVHKVDHKAIHGPERKELESKDDFSFSGRYLARVAEIQCGMQCNVECGMQSKTSG